MILTTITEQQHRLKGQIEYVLRRSAFYKKKYSQKIDFSRYFNETFSTLPFTSKKELLYDQEEYAPFGSNLCVSTEKIRRIHKTSGTTNKPLIIALTQNDIKETIRSGKNCFRSSGLTSNDIVIHCLNYNMWMGGYTDHQSLESTGAAVIPFGIGNSKNLLETIMLIRPTAIHCTPSYLAKLELILKNEFNLPPITLGLKLGLFGAESGLQNPEFRKNIEKVWGLKAMNANYGMADVLSMFGAECERQDGLHFMAENILYPELFDYTTGQMLPIEDQVEGELVLTNLCKEAQPLIRYRTNDIIKIISAKKCKCGRSSFRFEVHGRSDDMIPVKGVNVFISAIERVIYEHLDALSGVFQVHVNKEYPIDKLLIKIECRESQTLSDVSLKENLNRILSDRIGIRAEIEFIDAGQLPRFEGKSQKLFRIL